MGEEDQPGPILSLVRERPFDLVCLLSTPNTERHTCNTLEILTRSVATEQISVPLQDPTDYASILKQLRKITTNLAERFKGAEFYVAVASGTPQMHACWVLLVSSGEFVARILHIRPQRFVTKDDPIVSEIDVGALEFPVVRPPPRLNYRSPRLIAEWAHGPKTWTDCSRLEFPSRTLERRWGNSPSPS